MGTVDIINNIMDKYYFTEEIKDDEELKAILKKKLINHHLIMQYIH